MVFRLKIKVIVGIGMTCIVMKIMACIIMKVVACSNKGNEVSSFF